MVKNQPDIIFENDRFIAVNKPAGLLSIPDREQSQPSLKDMLITKYGTIYTVHRLDKDTSGIIVFAKDETTHKFLSQLFEERKVEKYYRGIVHGLPADKKGTIDAPISENPLQKGAMVIHRNGKPSVTDYEVIEGHQSYSLVQFRIHTGRTLEGEDAVDIVFEHRHGLAEAVDIQCRGTALKDSRARGLARRSLGLLR